MATLDLDPVFVKALRLLHSKSKDSALQLRAMLDESITARKAQKSSGSLDSDHKASSKSSKDEDNKKRSADKIKQDVSDISGPSETKRLKTDSSPTSSHSKEEKKEKEREKEKARKEKEKKEQKEKERERLEKERQRELEREREKEKEKLKEEESDEETEEDEEEEDDGIAVDADDFAIGLGISCEVCRQFDVSSGNQLVECQECHALYHQECHKPPVTEQDVNDPRFVWYCNKCSRSMKKMAAQKPARTKPEKPTTPVKEVVSNVKPLKPDITPATFAFRRLEVKPTTSNAKETPSVPVSSKPLLGLASLAANLSKPAATKPETSKPSQPAWKAELTKSSSKDGGAEKTVTRGEGGKTVKEGKTGEITKPGSPAGSGSGSKGGSGNGGKQSPASSASASSLASANKRLQIMKKNAARQQEKRVHIK
ncbi:hypothetical protein C0Q70_00436 [Pomacea canaliculata]|uniref:Integrator complex subunit 12 n=1 Tax=Pomacea canaliculata TaxID=400727 RepID=A0A2T7PWM7_POMCA|nr:integrator complex subunit 12-like [Pomacea canaliculata]PVD37834.1 hypothetical protein C0Q70_00436 [Pomacea canaliculata]